MEIDITCMFHYPEQIPLMSGSCAELGPEAGYITWENSKLFCENWYFKARPFLKTKEDFEAARDYFREFGAWSKEELDAMPDNEIQALLVQYIAGSIREMEGMTHRQYVAATKKGQVSGDIFKYGKTWYFTMSH